MSSPRAPIGGIMRITLAGSLQYNVDLDQDEALKAMHSDQLLFVYGSLRSGQSAHPLLQGAGFRGIARTAAAYTMFNLGGYPAVITGGKQRIVGEVYAVDAETLRRIDDYEDCPREYRRQCMATPYGAVWIYLYRHRRLHRPVIVSGDWLWTRARRTFQLSTF